MAIINKAPLLRQFLAVAREGSITGAAKVVGMTQPALTKSIQRLEGELGVDLFERGPRGARLTLYGRTLLAHAERIDAECRLTDLSFHALGKGNIGHLAVGTGSMFGATLVSTAVGKLYEHYPEVSIKLISAVRDVNYPRLLTGEIDLLFGLLPHIDDIPQHIVVRPLLELRQRVIAGSNHPLAKRKKVTAADIAIYPWVARQHDPLVASVIAALSREAGSTPRVRVEVTSLSSLLQILRSGTHLSYFEEVAAMDLPGVTLLPYARPVSQGSSGVLMHRSVERFPPVVKLVELVKLAARRRDRSTRVNS